MDGSGKCWENLGETLENAGKMGRNMEMLGKLEGQKAEHAGKKGGAFEENIRKTVEKHGKIGDLDGISSETKRNLTNGE